MKDRQKDARFGHVMRQMAKGDRVTLVLGGRTLGHVEMTGWHGAARARLAFILDREVVIQRKDATDATDKAAT